MPRRGENDAYNLKYLSFRSFYPKFRVREAVLEINENHKYVFRKRHHHLHEARVFFSSSELCLLLQVCPDRLKGQNGFRAVVAP